MEDFEAITGTFSRIGDVTIVDRNRKPVTQFSIGNDSNQPYFSLAALHALQANLKDERLCEDKKYVYIPLEILPRNKPVFEVVSLSADMEAFITQVRGFFLSPKTGVCEYTSLTNMISALVDLTWTKLKDTTLPSMMLILRSLLIDVNGDPGIPVVTDPNNIIVGCLNQVSETRSVSMALAHSKVKKYLHKLSTFTTVRGPSLVNPILGLSYIDDDTKYPETTDQLSL
jgi:hypothetical protein